MKDIDLESLEWALSQSDLKLNWSFARTATGDERLDDAPTKVGFFWKRKTQLEYSIELARNELSAVIKDLESKGAKVPDEFHKALRDFPT